MNFFDGKNDQMQKAEQLFRQMQPHLEAELKDRLVNGFEIEVTSPIRTFTEKVQKSSEKSNNISPRFSLGQETIPTGAKLLYKGCELNQMYFEDTNTGKEYGIFACDTVALGEMQAARNTGYIGLLTSTDIFQEVKNRILGR